MAPICKYFAISVQDIANKLISVEAFRAHFLKKYQFNVPVPLAIDGVKALSNLTKMSNPVAFVRVGFSSSCQLLGGADSDDYFRAPESNSYKSS